MILCDDWDLKTDFGFLFPPLVTKMSRVKGMTEQTIIKTSEQPAGIGVFEKWLSVWVALCIVLGIALGNIFPEMFQAIAGWEYASVNLLVAVLIWAMVYPMMVNVDFASLRHIGSKPKGLIVISSNVVT